MGLKPLLYFCVFVVFAIQFLLNPIPIGNERSKLQRAPIITIILIVVNVAVFGITFSPVQDHDTRLIAAGNQLIEFMGQHSPYLLFEDAQKKLKEAGLLEDGNFVGFNYTFKIDPPDDEKARRLVGEKAESLRAEFNAIVDRYQSAFQSHVFYRFGIAPNGNWKPHQLVTSIFLHGDFWHLAGNMLYFAAIALTLEGLWGRSIFLLFYLLVGVAACIPQLLLPVSVPSLGASGAISGLMGAFLVSLHKTKLKIFWLALPLVPFAPIMVASGKKPFGVVRIAAYIFLPYYFVSQMLMWWSFKEAKMFAGTAYSVHAGGFFFGVALAVALEYWNIRTHFFGLEYHESLAAAEVKEFTQGGQLALAEQKTLAFLKKHPDDIQALNELAQVYSKLGKHDDMNTVYARIIRRHLAHEDKQSALLAYDALLSGFPDNNVRPQLPANDWMSICDYIHKQGMVKEAAVEYERMANACKASSLALRAAVQGGEIALSVGDPDRARRLFELALELNPSPAHEPRIRRGIERCLSAMQPA
jgi:membrane associated rhomboid family serine protease